MQRVNSQLIFEFINKSSLRIKCINRLETDGRVYIKKRGKNASFFINLIAPGSNKNDGSDNVQRVGKSPESPKTAENLESFADHDLGIFLNITPNMNLINTPTATTDLVTFTEEILNGRLHFFVQ